MWNLLWKEWHEQSWKLGFGCIVLSALALIGLRARIVADETMGMWVCFMGITLLPVLSSTGLVPAERCEGSFESLLALPVAPWRILLAKTFIGFVLCAGPLAAAAVVHLSMAAGREMSSVAILVLYGRSALATISLFVWMLALTIRLPNETRAALLAMGVLIFWTLAMGGMGIAEIPSAVFALSPLGFVFGMFSNIPNAPQFTSVLVVQTALLALLWTRTSRRLSAEMEDHS